MFRAAFCLLRVVGYVSVRGWWACLALSLDTSSRRHTVAFLSASPKPCTLGRDPPPKHRNWHGVQVFRWFGPFSTPVYDLSTGPRTKKWTQQRFGLACSMCQISVGGVRTAVLTAAPDDQLVTMWTMIVLAVPCESWFFEVPKVASKLPVTPPCEQLSISAAFVSAKHTCRSRENDFTPFGKLT